MTGSSPRRQRLFLAFTLAVPVLFFATLESVLRVAWPDGALPAFDALNVNGSDLLVPSPRLGRRYFAGEEHPPTPANDAFARRKPARGFRIFILGESTAAGFPYPHNGTFSRVLRDALRDMMPRDSIEVVNLGLAATNSFTLVDLANDVIAQRPDLVIVYAGHNEYYGALGAGSSIRMGSSPTLSRLYLRAQRLRTVTLLRRAIDRVSRARRQVVTDSTAATFMESVAGDQRIELGGRAYLAGVAQFRENLTILLSRMRRSGVPVFIGSIASNVRDQRPFASPANGPARAAHDEGNRALAVGDSTRAESLFVRARDLDVVRFRAPTAFNEVIREVASATGARYVPVAERLADLSPAHAPGHELFLEHVHPNRHGYAVIGRAFIEALLAGGLRGRADTQRLETWDRYEARMELTPLDDRIVHHTVATITTRWPFVRREESRDYRGTFRPADAADSLAFAVSRGSIPWADAKLRMAAALESRGRLDSALAEYRGLVRDAPFLELPNRLAGRALATAGHGTEAKPYLERAVRAQPSAQGTYLLGVIALQEKDYPRAIALLNIATRMAPTEPAAAYQLSLAFGLSRNIGAARGAASRVADLDPRFPGLAEWMRILGMRSP